jgi:hypothetical protein
VTTKVNHDYTITCSDRINNSIVFRDMTGNDLEFLERVIAVKEDKTMTISSDSIISVLQTLLVSPEIKIESLTPRAIKVLFNSVSENILKSYMAKEDWLKQCYSIQNGSFQNVLAMEKVPMSKFTAMCLIHKEAMDSLSNDTKPADQI